MADSEQDPDEDDRETRVRRRAYRLWVEAGCPEGAALSNWLEAEAQDDADAGVDIASEDSFPASDPPSSDGVTGPRSAPPSR